MAFREFVDGGGRSWQAWDVRPDDLNPNTRDEDYLAQLYHTGWIVFETKSGDEKRRIYPIPAGWSELPDADLEVLLRKAEVVPKRKLEEDRAAKGAEAVQAMARTSDVIEHAADEPERASRVAREATPDVTDLNVVRTFRYPGGRIWGVRVMTRPDNGGPPVLRFAAGARQIDLKTWPKEWVDYTNDDLVALLRLASPRAPGPPPGPDTPRRRYSDVAAPGGPPDR